LITIKEVKGVRIPKDRAPTSPGEMLLEEFLKPLGMTQVELAERIRVPYVRVNELVNGKRRVTPSTALRLAKAFGTSPDFWLNGQLALDLYRAINDKKEIQEVEQIEPVLH
jgi:addiction module HigA family antidote